MNNQLPTYVNFISKWWKLCLVFYALAALVLYLTFPAWSGLLAGNAPKQPVAGLRITAPPPAAPSIPPETPAVSPSPGLTATPIPVVTLTSAVVGTDLQGYTNSEGSYGFNYPAGWHGFQIGSDVVYNLDQVKVEVTVQVADPEKTLLDYFANSEDAPSSLDKKDESLLVSGEPALCRSMYLAEILVGKACVVIHAGNAYTIGMYGNPDSDHPVVEMMIGNFDTLLASFRFTE